jgi:hypothetical protein
MNGRWRSFTFWPLARSSSATLPKTLSLPDGLRHTGIGEPQKRLREIDQSRAPSSHLPNWPSRTCEGIQLIFWLSATIRSRIAVTFTYHEVIAR